MFTVVILTRPLLPIDETRYLSVAWEMYLRHDWLAPLTMNGTPYHHKPPLLFWLINSLWTLTGPSRWAGTLPAVLAGIITVLMGQRLAHTLFQQTSRPVADHTPLIMMGGLAFLVYSTMVMFDVTLTAFVLGVLLCLQAYATKPRLFLLIVMGLLLGLGVLTKGPVAYLYIIFPALLGPLWHSQPLKPLIWYGGFLISLLISTLPVLLWLVPVLQQSDDHFAFWLLWEQTAGRVTGNFNDAHVRPFWFYLPILPLLLVPWIFFRPFWRNLHTIHQALPREPGLRFLLCWIIPVFISFSLISGKQPHYLLPLFPGLAILSAWLLRNVQTKTLHRTVTGVFVVFVLLHLVGAQTFLKDYDLQPVATYLEQHPDRDWGFVKKYHGELTFLARREKSLDEILLESEVPDWFARHPDGLVIMRFNDPATVTEYQLVFSIPYRGKTIGVFITAQQKAP